MPKEIEVITIPLEGELEGLARRHTWYDDGTYESALISLLKKEDNNDNPDDT